MAVLETIKTIGDLVPKIQELRNQCRQTCSDLEVVLVNLRQKAAEDLKQQEEAARKKENQDKYADLIKQREAEKIKAELSYDAKVAGKKTPITHAKTVVPIPAPNPTPVRKYEKSGLFGTPGTPDTSMRHNKPTPFNHMRRPITGNSKLPGGHRTWTPGQATANGYGAKHPINTFGRPNGIGTGAGRTSF